MKTIVAEMWNTHDEWEFNSVTSIDQPSMQGLACQLKQYKCNTQVCI